MIRILTDTASDISLKQSIDMGVTLVPLGVTFSGVEYDPAQDEFFEEFYRLLDTENDLPTTSQPSPADFLPAFTQAKTDGDEVIAIMLSSKLSGTMQSALIAKEMVDYDKIYIIDSLQAIIGLRLLVNHAVTLRDRGLLAKEIVAIISEAAGRVRTYGALDTLKFLRKGGRIPKTAELIGSALGVKPIVQLKDGNIEMCGKARGSAGAITGLINQVEKNPEFDPSFPVFFGYTYTTEKAKKLSRIATVKYHLENTETFAVGPIIGTHIGPGACAISYVSKT